MLQVSALACFRGQRLIFRDLSFSVKSGQWLHVRGANGAGKTTLLRVLCGLIRRESGEIAWNGIRIEEAMEEFRRNLSFLGHAVGMKDELTAIENLRFACDIRGETPRIDPKEALALVGLPHRAGAPLRNYSQGQRRRVALARVLISNAALWLLDEPLAALDDVATTNLMRQLDGHLSAGGMAMLTSHQPIALMSRGDVINMDDMSATSEC